MESSRAPATDNLDAMNGLWELVTVECGDGVSHGWERSKLQNPLNARRQVNNGQTIDYVVDSSSCMQTTNGHLISQGNFLFQYFGYQKFCSEQCGTKVSGCGPLNSSSLARIQIFEKEMLVSSNDPGICAADGQPGPLTYKYKLISKNGKH